MKINSAIPSQGSDGPPPLSETIIDYALTNKHCSKYIHLCRVMVDLHEKVIGDQGRGVGDHELILVEIKIPSRNGADRGAGRPN